MRCASSGNIASPSISLLSVWSSSSAMVFFSTDESPGSSDLKSLPSGGSEASCLAFLLRARNTAKIAPINRRIPRATPTPMPAFAPVESPGDTVPPFCFSWLVTAIAGAALGVKDGRSSGPQTTLTGVATPVNGKVLTVLVLESDNTTYVGVTIRVWHWVVLNRSIPLYAVVSLMHHTPGDIQHTSGNS